MEAVIVALLIFNLATGRSGENTNQPETGKLLRGPTPQLKAMPADTGEIHVASIPTSSLKSVEQFDPNMGGPIYGPENKLPRGHLLYFNNLQR